MKGDKSSEKRCLEDREEEMGGGCIEEVTEEGAFCGSKVQEVEQRQTKPYILDSSG
jgi:hypothetical protein